MTSTTETPRAAAGPAAPAPPPSPSAAELVRTRWRRRPPPDLIEGYEYVEAWGMASGAHAHVLRPTTVEGIRRAFEIARRDGVPLGLRGGGNSYGDASTNAGGHVLDVTRMDRILAWDAATGVATVEPGVTVRKLWRSILPDGWWPRVVSGTMFPTLAGAAAANIHGKNNYAVGTIGDAIRELDLVLPSGELRTCSRERNADLFHAAIGGFGMLGVFSRLVLETKKVHSGDLWVKGVSTHDLREMMDYFEAHKAEADYLVGWIDCFKGGDQLGRGLIHHARYKRPGEDPDPAATLRVAHQELPPNILGVVPKDQVWRILRLLRGDQRWRGLCALKYLMGRLEGMRGWYEQSHAGFAFLLDYVPNWKWAYGRRTGRWAMIQYQCFLPHETAHEAFTEILRRCQAAGHVSYLGVFKRHRPDPFWLTHALDGWSLAMDFPVGPDRRESLWRHLHGLTDLVLDHGGKFYFAKDSVLRPGDARRFLPVDKLEAFFRLKRELDPENLLQTDLSRRVFGE